MNSQLVILFRICFLYSIVFNNKIAFAQTAEKVSEKLFGLPGENKFSKAIRTKDGGYLMGADWSGNPEAFKAGIYKGGDCDFSIYKTDKKGKLLWNKSYGSQYKDNLTGLCEAVDGGYLIGGNVGWEIEQRRDSIKNFTDVTDSYKGRRDIWIIKVDAKGHKQWDKLIGGKYRDELGSILPLQDGFLLVGSSESEVSGNKTEKSRGGFDFWVIRIDLKGNIIWQKTLGGDKQDQASVAFANPDGSFIIGGTSNSEISGDKTQPTRTFFKIDSNNSKTVNNGQLTDPYNNGLDYWLVKLNSKGEKIWDRRYGGPADDNLRSILKLKDGNFLLGGTTHSGPGGDKITSQRSGGAFVSSNNGDYWIVKITAEGIQLWEKTYGGNRNDDFQSMIETTDGNLLLAGYSISESSGDKTESHRWWTAWLLKTDPNSNKIWDKQFPGPPNTDFYRLDLFKQSKGNYQFIGRSESRNQRQTSKMLKYMQLKSKWSVVTPNWLVKLKELDYPVISTGDVLPAICNTQPFDVPFTALGTFISGNIFSAQLSDSKGKFKKPVTIGKLESSSQGVQKITATIPNGIKPGSGYLVRVVSSDPIIIGKINTEKIGIGKHSIKVVVSPWMSPEGGVGPYEFSLDGGGFVQKNLPELIKFSKPGMHQVTIRDYRNCTLSKSFWKLENKGLSVPVKVEGVPNILSWFELPEIDRERKQYQGIIIEYEFEGQPARLDVYLDGLEASTKENKSIKGKLRFSYSYHDRNRDCVIAIQNMAPDTKCTFKLRLENEADNDD